LEYLIVYVGKPKGAKLGRSVYDKIKSDFPSKRVCQVRAEDQEHWDTFEEKVKEKLVLGFEGT
jgi:hypothetical protein